MPSESLVRAESSSKATKKMKAVGIPAITIPSAVKPKVAIPTAPSTSLGDKSSKSSKIVSSSNKPSSSVMSNKNTTKTNNKVYTSVKQKNSPSSVADLRVSPTEASKPKKAVSGENTGRWTKAEHERFLSGLDQYGKEWKKIANMIETRTVVQIRTHAQKYFQKIAKTKFESLGKQVPTDLMSTASNTSKMRKGGGNNGISLSTVYASADVPFGAKRDTTKDKNGKLKSKQSKAYPTAKQINQKENSKKGLNQKKLSVNTTLKKVKKPTPNGSSSSISTAASKSSILNSNSSAQQIKKQKLSSNAPASKTFQNNKIKKQPVAVSSLKVKTNSNITTLKRKRETETSGSGTEKLTISTTDIVSQRSKNDEEDLKWMVSNMPGFLKSGAGSANQPDASPTGVADLNLYRTFGSSSSEYESGSSASSDETTDMMNLYDNDSLMSDWMSSTKAGVDPTFKSASPVIPMISSVHDEEVDQLTVEPDGDSGNDTLAFDQMDQSIAEWINSPDESCTLEQWTKPLTDHISVTESMLF